MAMNDAVDWSRELGGGVRVALVQAGTFRSDAGRPVRARAVGPVGRPGRRRDRREAAPPPGAQLPADRDAGGAGPGRDRDRRAARRQDPSDSRRRGSVDRGRPRDGRLPARDRGCRRPEPPPLRPCRWTPPRRWGTGVPTRPDRRATSRVGGRAGRQPAARGVVRPAGAAARRGVGRGGLGRRRARAPARCDGRADRRPLDRPPGDRRARWGRRRADAGLLRRPVDAAVGGESALGHLVRRLPAGFGRPQGRALRPGRRRGLDRRPLARGPNPVGRLVRDRDRFRFEAD